MAICYIPSSYSKVAVMRVFMDNCGELLTGAELCEMKIDEVRLDVPSTETILSRIDDLVMAFEDSGECRQAYERLNRIYRIIRDYIPEDCRAHLMMALDDCFTDILTLFEEYFYKNGLADGKLYLNLLKIRQMVSSK